MNEPSKVCTIERTALYAAQQGAANPGSSIQSWKTRSRVRALAKMQKALENNGLKKEIRSKDLLNEDELDDAADYDP